MDSGDGMLDDSILERFVETTPLTVMARTALERALDPSWVDALFEDQRDTIKLKNLVSTVVDDETQQKIDVVKQRLIKYFGYNETSATDVLNYVASIFARGDSKQDE